MTNTQANRLLQDWGESLAPDDFCEDLYISIKGIGTKTFRGCAYHEIENFVFIWSRSGHYLLDKKELGDFVIVPVKEQPTYSTVL